MNNWKKLLTPFDKSYSLEKKISVPHKTPDKNTNFLFNLTPNLKENKNDPLSNQESSKKLKDFVSYLKLNPQKNIFMNSNFQIMQSQFENLKETLKRKLFDNKQNTGRTQMNGIEKIEKIYDSHNNPDETSNLNRTLDTLKNYSINKKKDNSLKKILLISKSIPKSKESDDTNLANKLKTLKKKEEQNVNQERTTILKKNKFPSSTEDEILELLNKSCYTTSNKKNANAASNKKSPSFFLDSDISSHHKNSFDQAVIVTSCDQRIDCLSDKIKKEHDKRIDLEKKVYKSNKDMESVKMRLQFIEEKLNSTIPKNSQISTKKNNMEDPELINCCVTSQKKQNSFESLSNVKVSEFRVDEFINTSQMKTKKIRNSNQKSTFHLDDSTIRSQEIKKKLMKGFKSIIGCIENNKNENQNNLDELSKKLTQKLMVFQKAKEKFNRKFRRILQQDRENEKFNETDFVFSLTNSNVRATPGDREKRSSHIKHPTFSYSEYNVDYKTFFSNSLEKIE